MVGRTAMTAEDVALCDQLVSLTLDPFSDAFLADPYGHHATLRDVGPVVWFEAIQSYGLARFSQVSAALKDHLTFCSAAVWA